jgi:hypothetical protein
MISIHAKDFCEKMILICEIFIFFFFNHRISTTGRQNIIGLFFLKRLSHLLYNQIWLNLFVDNHQFGLVFFFWVQNFAKM